VSDDLELGARVSALGANRSAATALRGKLSPRRDARYGKDFSGTAHSTERYREPIKDVDGNDRYVLSLAPLHVEGDIQIVSWEAKLADLQHRTYANVLMASQIPSDDPVNNAWWLDPGKFARVPVRTARIIKVDGFYVVLKVMAYHFTPSESPYLDSMTVQVNITNTDPRAAKNSGGSGARGSIGSTGN
jgi:hypothetical protein